MSMGNVHPFHSRDEIQAEARSWVLKFNADSPPDEEDIQALREWAGRSNVHFRELELAQAFWCEADLLSELAVPLRRDRRFPKFQLFYNPLTAIAAVLLLSLSIGLYYFQLSGKAGNGIYYTQVGEQHQLTLFDESKIELDTDSRIEVIYSDRSRQVYLLQGKAYFEVSKDPERPFEVYARGGIVQAVGTAFSVYLAPEDVEVAVDEGRVNLYRIKQPEISARQPSQQVGSSAPQVQDIKEIFLSVTKGQTASFTEKQQKVSELAEEEMSNELSWRSGLLVFTNDSLSQVIDEVSRYTATKIEIADPALNDLKVGGRFKVGELEALFDVLEAGFGVQVSHLDSDHILLGKVSP